MNSKLKWVILLLPPLDKWGKFWRDNPEMTC